MKIETLIERRQPCRKVQGIAAALLPYEAGGRVAVDAFQRHLMATHRAGLMNAVNMDTGYVNYLSETEKLEVLRWTREVLGKDAPFVGGAYIEEKTAMWARCIESRWMPLLRMVEFQFCFKRAACMANLRP